MPEPTLDPVYVDTGLPSAEPVAPVSQFGPGFGEAPTMMTGRAAPLPGTLGCPEGFHLQYQRISCKVRERAAALGRASHSWWRGAQDMTRGLEGLGSSRGEEDRTKQSDSMHSTLLHDPLRHPAPESTTAPSQLQHPLPTALQLPLRHQHWVLTAQRQWQVLTSENGLDKHIDVGIYTDSECRNPVTVSRAPAEYGAMGMCSDSRYIYQVRNAGSLLAGFHTLVLAVLAVVFEHTESEPATESVCGR